MRVVTEDMVVLENASFSNGAQGYFTAMARCPNCGEERLVTVSIWEQGQQERIQAGCNSGHIWTVRASVVR